MSRNFQPPCSTEICNWSQPSPETAQEVDNGFLRILACVSQFELQSPNTNQHSSAQKVGFQLIPERAPKSVQKCTLCSLFVQNVCVCVCFVHFGLLSGSGGTPVFFEEINVLCVWALLLELKYRNLLHKPSLCVYVEATDPKHANP